MVMMRTESPPSSFLRLPGRGQGDTATGQGGVGAWTAWERLEGDKAASLKGLRAWGGWGNVWILPKEAMHRISCEDRVISRADRMDLSLRPWWPPHHQQVTSYSKRSLFSLFLLLVSQIRGSELWNREGKESPGSDHSLTPLQIFPMQTWSAGERRRCGWEDEQMRFKPRWDESLKQAWASSERCGTFPRCP